VRITEKRSGQINLMKQSQSIPTSLFRVGKVKSSDYLCSLERNGAEKRILFAAAQ
jgi:hypothetical protein